MNYKLIIGVAALMLAACNTTKKNVETQSEQLATRMAQLQQRGYMYGHQDDPMYGLTWKGTYAGDSAELGRSDVLELVGDYPGVMGFDLGGIEMGDARNLDSVPFQRIHDELVAHVQRGGIVTLSWHPRNPLTGSNAWDVSDTTVVRNCLPGGSVHEKFQTWMQRVGDFIETLKDDEGQPVPVIFRPWHENSGSWFWWGKKLCTADEYKALWNMLQDKLNADSLSNLLWAYSPNMSANLTEEQFMERYPGDDRVSLVGIDGYQWAPTDEAKEQYMQDLSQNLTMVCNFAKRHGKIAALTECGLKNLTDPTWWTSTLKPVTDRYDISYFLFWRNYSEEWFGPSPVKPDAQYFVDLYNADNTLFLRDIQ